MENAEKPGRDHGDIANLVSVKSMRNIASGVPPGYATVEAAGESHTRVPDQLIEDHGMTWVEAGVWSVLRRMESWPDGCKPSYKYIGERLGMSASTAKRHVEALANNGWVAVTNRKQPQKKNWLTNEYRTIYVRRVVKMVDPSGQNEPTPLVKMTQERESSKERKAEDPIKDLTSTIPPLQAAFPQIVQAWTASTGNRLYKPSPRERKAINDLYGFVKDEADPVKIIEGMFEARRKQALDDPFWAKEVNCTISWVLSNASVLLSLVKRGAANGTSPGFSNERDERQARRERLEDSWGNIKYCLIRNKIRSGRDDIIKAAGLEKKVDFADELHFIAKYLLFHANNPVGILDKTDDHAYWTGVLTKLRDSYRGWVAAGSHRDIGSGLLSARPGEVPTAVRESD